MKIYDTALENICQMWAIYLLRRRRCFPRRCSGFRCHLPWRRTWATGARRWASTEGASPRAAAVRAGPSVERSPRSWIWCFLSHLGTATAHIVKHKSWKILGMRQLNVGASSVHILILHRMHWRLGVKFHRFSTPWAWDKVIFWLQVQQWISFSM